MSAGFIISRKSFLKEVFTFLLSMLRYRSRGSNPHCYLTTEHTFNKAYEAYLDKLGRDELREELEEKTINYSIYTLCFFDGTEEVMLTDTFVGDYYYSNCSTATDAPVITYTAYNQSTLDKVKLSEISSIYDIEEMVRAVLFSSSDRYVAIKGNATVIDQKDGTFFNINSSGTILYYIDEIPDNKEYGELYRVSIKDGSVAKPELYDSDVYPSYCCFVSDSQYGRALSGCR